MGGKYDDVNKNLPRHRPVTAEEMSYQDKVSEEKRAFLEDHGDPSTPELVRQYVTARTRVDDIKRDLKDAQLTLEAVSQLLTEAYDDDGVTSMKVTGATVRVQVEPYSRVMNHAALRNWCCENNMFDSLQLPWQSLNKIVKERLLDGKNEPPGVEAYQKQKLVLTRDKKRYGDAEVMPWTNPTGGGEVEDNAGTRDNPCVVCICEDDGEE